MPTRPGLLQANLFDDELVGRFRIGLVEHDALVPGAFEHRGQRHDADGREAHDANVTVRRPGRRRQRVELWVTDMDEKDEQWSLPRMRCGRTVTVVPS